MHQSAQLKFVCPLFLVSVLASAALLVSCSRSSREQQVERMDTSSATTTNTAILSSTNLPATETLPSSPEPEFDIDRASDHLSRGNRLLSQGLAKEAVSEFQRATKFNPEDEDIYYNLAYAQARAGDRASAKANYGKALELFPDYVDAHNNLGNILVDEGNFAEAIQHFEQALANDNESATAHNNL